MNILHVNNFHYLRGGAEAVYFNTSKLLQEHGHRSLFFSMHHPENLPCETEEFFMPFVDLNAKHSIWEQLRIAGRILYSIEARKRLSRLLDKYPIDIAHLHNIYYDLSPSILHEFRKRNIPTVLTIHDPKMVCGSHNLYIYVNDNGKVCQICEACSGRKYYMSVVKKCVKESYAKSALAAMEMYLHHKVLDIYKNIDVLIAPSLFFKNKFNEMGFNKEMMHLPYFIDAEKVRELQVGTRGEKVNKTMSVVFFGRLSLEKGLFTLLKAAKRLLLENSKMQIIVIGDGPIGEQLRQKVRDEKIENVHFLGYMKHKDMYKQIKKSMASVLMSEWYDNYPMSIIESFAIGIPVVGARIGGVPEMVKDYETGLTFEPWNDDDLFTKIKYIEENPDMVTKWGDNAKLFVDEELNAKNHYGKLMEIYKRAVKSRK